MFVGVIAVNRQSIIPNNISAYIKGSNREKANGMCQQKEKKEVAAETVISYWYLDSVVLNKRPGQVDSWFIVPTGMCFYKQNNISFIVPHLIIICLPFQTQFITQNSQCWIQNEMIINPLQLSKSSIVKLLEFLQILRECANETFISNVLVFCIQLARFCVVLAAIKHFYAMK